MPRHSALVQPQEFKRFSRWLSKLSARIEASWADRENARAVDDVRSMLRSAAAAVDAMDSATLLNAAKRERQLERAIKRIRDKSCCRAGERRAVASTE